MASVEVEGRMPTDAELEKEVREMLGVVNLEEVSLKIIRKRLEDQLQVGISSASVFQIFQQRSPEPMNLVVVQRVAAAVVGQDETAQPSGVRVAPLLVSTGCEWRWRSADGYTQHNTHPPIVCVANEHSTAGGRGNGRSVRSACSTFCSRWGCTAVVKEESLLPPIFCSWKNGQLFAGTYGAPGDLF